MNSPPHRGRTIPEHIRDIHICFFFSFNHCVERNDFFELFDRKIPYHVFIIFNINLLLEIATHLFYLWKDVSSSRFRRLKIRRNILQQFVNVLVGCVYLDEEISVISCILYTYGLLFNGHTVFVGGQWCAKSQHWHST